MTDRIDQAGHLVGRFFGHIRAEPPGPDDQLFVHDHLEDACADLFWSQNPADQRHAVDVARRVSAALPDDSGAVEAALLHDIGKVDANIGAVARSIATVLDSVGMPMTTRMRSYRDHGRRGAVVLEEAGCSPLTVAFARYHPGPAPAGTDPVRWKVLIDADG
ncbi:MAG: HD domain-containing protein [Acidimicrobiia bacterium]